MHEWATFLLHYGGHTACLGFPALLATVTFLLRIRWLQRNKIAHGYGRTALIYWPTQFFLLMACVLLLALAFSLASGPYLPNVDGLLSSAILMWIAWVRTNRHSIRCRELMPLPFKSMYPG